MASTPSGTVYTPESFTVSDGGPARWYMRDDQKHYADVPILLFCHGSGGDELAFDWSGWNTLRNGLIDAGWCIIEGLSHLPDGRHWGNPHGQAMYLEMLAHVRARVRGGQLVILGQSMGALVAYNLYAKQLASQASALLIFNGVTNLVDYYSKSTYALMNDRWGVPGAVKDMAGFTAATVDADPMRFPASLWTGKRVVQVWGTTDPLTPPLIHGAAWVDKYGDELADLQVVVGETAGHDPTPAQQTTVLGYLTGITEPRRPNPDRVYTIRMAAGL